MNYNFDSSTGEYTPLLRDNYKIPIRLGYYTKMKPKESPDSSGPRDIYKSPLSDLEAPTTSAKAETYTTTVNTSQKDLGLAPTYRVNNAVKRPNVADISEGNTMHPELKKLIKPFTCDLCSVSMNSPVSAKDHYDSKNHEKKVNAWLKTNAETNDEPGAKFRKCEADSNSKANSTSYADVVGLSVKRSWERQKEPTNSRFGIGETFRKVSSADDTQVSPERDEKTYCQVCDISVTCPSQLKAHLEGSKHAKKLKATGGPPSASPNDTVLASLYHLGYQDMSIYRTPTGHYYCSPCNITADTESIFMQHIKGKKHAKKNKTVPQV